MSRKAKMLWICVGETDQTSIGPLYEALIRRLRQLGLAGATAHTGIMGFGTHRKLHEKRLFHVADDRPVTIVVVDEEEKIREVLPEIRALVREGLIALLDAELIEAPVTRT